MSLPLSKFVKMLCTNKIVKKLEKETFKHAPELLITLGITGFVTGTVVAVTLERAGGRYDPQQSV